MADEQPAHPPTPLPPLNKWDQAAKYAKDVYYMGRAAALVIAILTFAAIYILPDLLPFGSLIFAIGTVLGSWIATLLLEAITRKPYVRWSVYPPLTLMIIVFALLEADRSSERVLIRKVVAELKEPASNSEDIAALRSALERINGAGSPFGGLNYFIYLFGAQFFGFRSLTAAERRFDPTQRTSG